jgi:hypothetical protein
MATAEPGLCTEPFTSADEMRTATAASRAVWSRQPRGTRIAGAAALALGTIGLIRGDFTIVWHPVSEALYWRTELAYATAFLFILTGLGSQHRRAVLPAGLVLCALYLLLSLGWLNRVFALPGVIGTWLGFSEQVALAIGAAAIALQAPGHSQKASTACRVAFGASQLVFGLAHFLSLSETVAMTPAWLPPGRTFWALATGAAHFAGGVALITGFRPIAATRALAAMFVMFVMFVMFGLLVWLPRLVAEPSAEVPWAGNAINLALVGAVLALGDLLARRDRA